MRLHRLALLALPPVLLLVLDLPSFSTGIYFPGSTQMTPACGACHRFIPGAAPGFPAIAITLSPSTRSLAANQAIQVTLSATGGQNASPNGGFACDANDGTFSAGANTRVIPFAPAITHTSSSARAWSFGYTAPATSGLIEMFAVVNTVNNDLVPGDEDMWAFHGFDETATQGTPVRLYVNPTGVVALGQACAGSFGNVPVLGCPTAPTIGNAGFSFAIHGAAPNSAVHLMLAATAFNPGIDLGFVGVPGCSLFVNPLVTLPGTTGAGDAQRGEGSASIGLPIPNDVNLIGATLHFQAFIVDLANGRPAPLTLTNGLSVTLQ